MQGQTKPLVSFRHVKKTYDGETLVVKDLNLDIQKGELWTLLGPSGSGKTTCLMMLAGFEYPTDGEIWLDGQLLNRIPPHKRNIGMVFQNYALFPHLTVAQNLEYPLKVRKVPPDEQASRVKRALEMVGMGKLGKRMPSQLSGGQQQRVALARALVFNPQLVLMDEPLGALDKQLREHMQLELKALHEALGLTFVYVTHDQSEALAVSDQIIVMRDGLIAQAGSPSDLYERPNSEFVAGFMGEALLLPANVTHGGEVQLGPLSWRAPDAVPTGRALVAVRPEAWMVGDPGQYRLSARVRKATYLGGFYEYTLDTEIGELFVVCPHVDRSRTVAETVSLGMHQRGVSVLRAS